MLLLVQTVGASAANQIALFEEDYFSNIQTILSLGGDYARFTHISVAATNLAEQRPESGNLVVALCTLFPLLF